MSQELSLQFRA